MQTTLAAEAKKARTTIMQESRTKQQAALQRALYAPPAKQQSAKKGTEERQYEPEDMRMMLREVLTGAARGPT